MRHAPLFLGATLLAMWLLLSGDLSFASILFGVLLALVLISAIARLRPARPRLQHLHLLLPLTGTLLMDIARSNFAVAGIVLGLVRRRKVRSGFLDIPLELRDPHALAVLALIVTSTPGTSWAGLSPDGRVLRLHVLDLRDEDEWVELFKRRYERLLLRIFQ